MNGSSPQRLILFLVLSFALMYGTQYVMLQTGLIQPPKPPVVAPPEDAAKAELPKAAADPAKPAPAAPVDPAKVAAKKAEPPLVKPSDLVLGASDDPSPTAYRMEVRLDQYGAGVRQVASARYDGETIDGIPDRRARLQLIRDDPMVKAPAPFAITVQPGDKPLAEGALPTGEIALDSRSYRWEVVRETPEGPVAKPITKEVPGLGKVEGQEISFRTVLDGPGLTISKRFRIWKGEDGFEVALTFSGSRDGSVAYRLFGPHGVPIEGEAYTSNFRDVFFGQLKGGRTEIVTRSAADVVKDGQKDAPETFTAAPIQFAGVENQYFAVFFEPDPRPTTQEGRWEQKTMALVARENVKEPQKSDVGVEISSVRLPLEANKPVTHTYRVYAGPKIAASLAPYDASELASYRKYQMISIPFASSLAQNVIAPLLDRIYTLTWQVAALFGGKSGNYGIAIVLLTMTVRLCLFPLGRKQAMISKKMQEIQPLLVAMKEKYKDDKERQTRETFALYKEHGFNPAAGCLPALIQMPIFVGLWQALNNSVALRHSRFLYIQNLAAPDMLFSFGTDVPYIGKYFNLLPFLVVSLMLVQTKLFTPPAVTDEARMQQKMMKYMMVFMAFMFYRVPSGLGIYFITSSLWQVGERLILPKMAARKALKGGGAEGLDPPGNGGPGGSPPAGPRGPSGWIAKRLEKLMEEAANERTIRNNNGNSNGNGNVRSAPPDRNRNRPRPGKRR